MADDKTTDWAEQKVKAEAVLTGRKAERESFRAKTERILQEVAPGFAEELETDGTLAPAQLLGAYRFLESMYALSLKHLTKQGLVAMNSQLLVNAEMVTRQVLNYASAVGRQEANEVYFCLPDEERERARRELLGEGDE